MKRKILVRDLKRLIRESLLVEELETSKELPDSLDAQVDKLFVEYENQAKKNKLESKFKSSIIKEKDEKEKESLNVDSFTTDLIRLINNYDSLLEVKNTLLKRAVNFLSKNYDQSVINELKNTLREVHGIVIDKSEFELSDENFPAPPAERSGAGGAGGA